MGFSRNLQGIDKIPDEMNLVVERAFEHESQDTPPLKNIRLVVDLPSHIPADWRAEIQKVTESMLPHHLDITQDAWVELMGKN